MSSVLCAVGHGLYDPWLKILKHGQEQTWLQSPLPKSIEIIHFHGTPVKTFGHKIDRLHEYIRWSNGHPIAHRALKIFDNVVLSPWLHYIPKIGNSEILSTKHQSLHVRFPDTYLTYRWKALSLMNYFLNKTDHDYLLSTSTASYINLEALSTRIQAFSSGDLYFGSRPYVGAEFVSGSNRILSRATVEKIISFKKYWQPGIIEDVALGKLLKRIGVTPTFIPILNISSLDKLDSLEEKTFQENYHFRLKSGKNTERNDVIIMKALHSKYGNK